MSTIKSTFRLNYLCLTLEKGNLREEQHLDQNMKACRWVLQLPYKQHFKLMQEKNIQNCIDTYILKD